MQSRVYTESSDIDIPFSQCDTPTEYQIYMIICEWVQQKENIQLQSPHTFSIAILAKI